MKRLVTLTVVLLALVMYAATVSAGMLISAETLRNARNNAADPLFAGAIRDSSVVGYAVRAVVTENEAATREARIGILRAVRDAQTYLPDARMLPGDRSSQNVYTALLAYNILSTQSDAFTPDDNAGITRACIAVLDHYLDPGFCDWSNDAYAVGISALRIVAACALYADTVSGTPAAQRFLQHAVRYLDTNINRGIDEYGAWVAGSPGGSGDAIEYITVAGKILRGNGFNDPFAQRRAARLVVNGMHLMLPQSMQGVGQERMVSIGMTDPAGDVSSQAMLAVSDVYRHFPDEASMAVWYWNRCGNPAGPLGVLFGDTLIPYMRPDGTSTIAGAGTVVFRDRFATSAESMVAITFGDPRGMTDRERRDHQDAGDFSYIWQGMPVILHDGYAPDTASDLILNRQSWRHSTVLPSGDGSSPVIQTRQSGLSSVSADPLAPLSDFFPDGLNQFMSTGELDYAAGTVINSDHPSDAFSHTRQFMFIKPDALVIHDRVSADGPVDWNLWTALADTTMRDGALTLRSGSGVELQTVFAGMSSLETDIVSPPAEAVGEWPFIMQAAYGAGTVVLVSIDPAAAVNSDYGPVVGHLYENLAAPLNTTAAVIDRTGNLQQLLAGSALTVTPFDRVPDDGSSLAWYGTVYANLDQPAGLGVWRTLLDRQVRPGGTLVLAGTGRAFLDSDSTGGEPTLAMGADSLPVRLPFDASAADIVTLHDDPAWSRVHRIPAESFTGFLERLLGSVFLDDVVSPVTVPPVWSDNWMPIATIRQSFPVQASADTTNAPMRVMVRAPDSGSMLTLLLPSRERGSYRFTVDNHTSSFISFSGPVTTWDVAAGVSSWSNAILSAHMTGTDGANAYWAFDATSVMIGEERLTARNPFSFYYDVVEDRGIIQSAENNELSFSGGLIRLHAGEVTFTNLSVDLIVRRERFNSIVRVVDSAGFPLSDARVMVDGSFIGATGPDGTIAVGWTEPQPSVLIRRGSLATSGMLTPGLNTFALY